MGDGASRYGGDQPMKNYASKAFEGLFGKSLAEPLRKYESILPKEDEEHSVFYKNMTKLIEITLDLGEVPASCTPELKSLLKSVLEEKAKYPKESQAVQDCVARKIPRLMDEGKEQEQAIAIAFSMCREQHKSKDGDPYSQLDEKKPCVHGQAWGTCQTCIDAGKGPEAEKDRVTAPAALGGKKKLTPSAGQATGPVVAAPFEDSNSQPLGKGGGTAPSITAGPKIENSEEGEEKNYPLNDQSLSEQTRRAGNEGPNLEPRERPKNPMAIKARELVGAVLEEVRKKAGPGAPPGPKQSAAAREAWRKRHAAGEEGQETPEQREADEEAPGVALGRATRLANRAGLAVADLMDEAEAQLGDDPVAQAAFEQAEAAFMDAVNAYNEGDPQGAFQHFEDAANALRGGAGEAPVGETPVLDVDVATPEGFKAEAEDVEGRAYGAYAKGETMRRKDPERAAAVQREAQEAANALSAAKGHAKKGDEERAANALETARLHTEAAENLAAGKAAKPEPEVGPDEVTPAATPAEDDPFATPEGGDPFAEEEPEATPAATPAEEPDEEPERDPTGEGRIINLTPEAQGIISELRQLDDKVESGEMTSDEAESRANELAQEFERLQEEGKIERPEEERPAEEPARPDEQEEAPGGAPEATPEDEKPTAPSKQPHVKAAGAAASRTYSILRDEKAPEEARAAAQRAQDAAGEAAFLEGEGKREEALERAEEAEQAAREAERLAGREAAGAEEATPTEPGRAEEPEPGAEAPSPEEDTERLEDEEPDPEA
jgi:hypothetical protein